MTLTVYTEAGGVAVNVSRSTKARHTQLGVRTTPAAASRTFCSSKSAVTPQRSVLSTGKLAINQLCSTSGNRS